MIDTTRGKILGSILDGIKQSTETRLPNGYRLRVKISDLEISAVRWFDEGWQCPASIPRPSIVFSLGCQSLDNDRGVLMCKVPLLVLSNMTNHPCDMKLASFWRGQFVSLRCWMVKALPKLFIATWTIALMGGFLHIYQWNGHVRTCFSRPAHPGTWSQALAEWNIKIFTARWHTRHLNPH
jgi:hypothetical protein